MKKNRKYKKIKIIMVFTTVLLIAFVAVVGLYKTFIVLIFLRMCIKKSIFN